MTRHEINIPALRSWMQLPYEAEAMLREIVEKSIFQKFDAYSRPMLGNCLAKYWPLVVRGRIRVFLESPDDNGQQIALYEIQPGEACPLSQSCMALGAPFPAFTEALSETYVMLIPLAQLKAYMKKCDFFSDYVMRSANQRLLQVIEAFSARAFAPVDSRVKQYLLNKKNEFKSDYLPITHRQIAHDLGTAREVVSRALAQLKKEKVIALARGELTILDSAALEYDPGHRRMLRKAVVSHVRVDLDSKVDNVGRRHERASVTAVSKIPGVL